VLEVHEAAESIGVSLSLHHFKCLLVLVADSVDGAGTHHSVLLVEVSLALFELFYVHLVHHLLLVSQHFLRRSIFECRVGHALVCFDLLWRGWPFLLVKEQERFDLEVLFVLTEMRLGCLSKQANWVCSAMAHRKRIDGVVWLRCVR
jgi:hypothetical protein